MRRIKAFTLIELLVVIAIIGILSALIVVGMNSTTQKATIAKAQVFSNSLRNSLMGNLISEWKFDEINVPAAGETPDSLGANKGTMTGITLQDSGCIFGKCLSFNGSNDKVTMGSALLTGAGDLTVSAWIKRSVLNSTDYILGNYGSGNYGGLEFYLLNTGGGNKLSFYITGAVYSTVAIDTNWHLATATRQSGAISVYVDGKKDGTGTLVASITGTNPFTVGNGHDYTSEAFAGLIDNVRIYNAAIPTSQVQQMYFAGINRLFTKNQITLIDYQQRLSELTNNYAQN
jgi:prepilin-type N-terminal cleavage/methylation domain-containing protein